MDKLSPQEIGKEIRKEFPYFDDPTKGQKLHGLQNKEAKGEKVRSTDKFSKEWKTSDEGAAYEGSARFNDFCQIGALLTDESCCLGHLDQLEKLLWARLAKLTEMEMEKIRPNLKEIKRIELKTGLDSPDTPTNNAHKELKEEFKEDLNEFTQWANRRKFKFYGVLDLVLGELEQKWGFGLNAGRVSLDGFVHPASFNEELLRKKRHWKDPGADPIHGEYSHRLQWFLICYECEKRGPYKLKKEPVSRFAATAAYAKKHAKKEVYELNGIEFTLVTMWDFLCDCVRSRSPQSSTNFISDSFRSPEYLNLYLTDPAGNAKDRFPLLNAYLTQRFNKRNWQKVNGLLADYLKKKYKNLNFDELPGQKDDWGLSGGKLVPRSSKAHLGQMKAEEK
jgi:hypothetical protein